MKRIRSKDEIQKMRQQFTQAIEQGELGLAEATRRMRHIVGKTIPDYAKILKISERTLSDIENNAGNPKLETLEKIAKPFGLQISFIPKQKEKV